MSRCPKLCSSAAKYNYVCTRAHLLHTQALTYVPMCICFSETEIKGDEMKKKRELFASVLWVWLSCFSSLDIFCACVMFIFIINHEYLLVTKVWCRRIAFIQVDRNAPFSFCCCSNSSIFVVLIKTFMYVSNVPQFA